MAKRIEHEDNPTWTKERIARAMPLSKLPLDVQQAIRGRKRGPQKTPKKEPVLIRLSPDVLIALRATGKGWQSRMNEILRAWTLLLPPTAKSLEDNKVKESRS